MNKLIRVILVSLFFMIISLLILSPLVSLILPHKLRYYEYRKLVDRVIADKETSAASNSEEKAEALFEYVVNHEFLQGLPYSCKPLESLIYAEAYCDFQARTLNALLAAAGIQSRYAMLIDENGVSTHTLNEILLNNEWRVFDTTMNIVFASGLGEKFSLEEVSDKFELFLANPKLSALKEYDNEKYRRLVKFYSAVLPLRKSPIRSTSPLRQAHIFDKITDLYFKLFKYRFFNFYQDLYLKSKELAQDDFRFFYLARNYHLTYRNDLALSYYQALLKRYPRSEYAQDAIFFCGMLYFEEKDYPRAVELFKQIIDKYPVKWDNEAYYYSGRIYEAIGDEKNMLLAYSHAEIERLPESVIWKLVKFEQERINNEKNKRVSFFKRIHLFFHNIFMNKQVKEKENR